MKEYNTDNLNRTEGINYDSKEKVVDILPEYIPDVNEGDTVKDSNYVDEMYSDEQLERHKDEANIFKVDGVPSRFEHNKERSTWHFDPMLPAAEEFQVICKFQGDWEAGLERALNDADEQTLGNYRPRSQSKQDKDLQEGELMDVKRASGKDDVSCMYNTGLRRLKDKETLANGGDPVWNDRRPPEYDPFWNMAEGLGIEVHQMRVHVQLLGQVTPMHIDQQMRYARPQWRKIWKDGGGDKNPLNLRRVLIALGDWDYGHAWCFGNKWYSGYKAGECVMYDWCNMPHGTANFGYNPRFTLQITGFISDKTRELMKNGSANHIIQV